MAARFEHDDAGYLAWASSNPAGFVLNVRATNDPSYVVLHRANCRSIQAARPPGAYTARGYRKVCSPSLADLESWAKAHGRPDGTFSKLCGVCRPPGMGR
jgi:hypothetical protein